MNRWTIRTLAFASFALLIFPAAMAQQGGFVKADIPFEFRIDNQLYPPGEYTVLLPTNAQREQLILLGPDGKALRFLNTVSAKTFAKMARPYFMFRGYGKDRFLAQVSSGYAGTTRGLTMSRAEREVAEALKIAGNSKAAESIRVAAK